MGYLTVVLSMLSWTLLPLVLGWQPAVVLSGSMEPGMRRGDMAVDRLIVLPVTHRVVDDHHARPGPLPVGNIEQRIDRAGRGIDLDCRHASHLTV